MSCMYLTLEIQACHLRISSRGIVEHKSHAIDVGCVPAASVRLSVGCKFEHRIISVTLDVSHRWYPGWR